MTAATTLADELTAILADTVDVSGAAITGLTFVQGRRELVAHAVPPRVVWVRSSATPGGAVKSAFPNGARSVLTRVMELELHCWGATEEATDALVAAVLAACHRRWYGRFSYLGEQWEEAPAQSDFGEKAVVRVSVQTAVLDRPKTTVTVQTTAFDTTSAALGDGVLHVGETT